MKTVNWLDAALDDLEELALYIAQDNVDRAITFTNEIRDKANMLNENPYMGKRIAENIDERYRAFIHRNYTVYYEIREKDILILEIFNQARIHHRFRIL